LRGVRARVRAVVPRRAAFGARAVVDFRAGLRAVLRALFAGVAARFVAGRRVVVAVRVPFLGATRALVRARVVVVRVAERVVVVLRAARARVVVVRVAERAVVVLRAARTRGVELAVRRVLVRFAVRALFFWVEEAAVRVAWLLRRGDRRAAVEAARRAGRRESGIALLRMMGSSPEGELLADRTNVSGSRLPNRSGRP